MKRAEVDNAVGQVIRGYTAVISVSYSVGCSEVFYPLKHLANIGQPLIHLQVWVQK